MGPAGSPTVFDATQAAPKESVRIEHAHRSSMMPLSRRILLIGSSIILAVALAFLLERLFTIRPDRPFGHTQSGHLTGWLGLLIILLVFIYPIKKRRARERRWPKGWFRVHMTAGFAGPLVVLIHSGSHFHAIVPVLTLILLAAVTLSGIVGQTVHYLVLRTLHEHERMLRQQGLSEDVIESRLHSEAAKESAFRLWQFVHAPLTIAFIVLLSFHIIGAVYFTGF